jgi:Mg2+ and Co2+ transporter CorA
MLLEHNETFQKEIETFRKKAEEIEHQATKDKINDLVSKLIFEVKAVDKHHNDIIRGQGLPDSMSASREKIMELRKQLDRLTRDYNKKTV